MPQGVWIRPTGNTVRFGKREAREVSAFLTDQGSGSTFLPEARVENWGGVTGCLARTGDELLAIKGLPFRIGKRLLDPEWDGRG